MVKTITVSVVHEGKGAVKDSAAWMANCNAIYHEDATLFWMMFSTFANMRGKAMHGLVVHPLVARYAGTSYNMCKFFLARLFNANIMSPHSLHESVLLIAVMQYCKDCVSMCMVFKQQQQQAETIPDLFRPQVKAEPVVGLILGLREAAIVYSGRVCSRCP